MTDLTEATMSKFDEEEPNGRPILWMTLAGLGIVMTLGAIAGFLAEHRADGGGDFSTAATVILAVFGAIIVALSYAILRQARKLGASGERLTARERLNRNIMTASFAAGGVLGLVLAFSNMLDGELGFEEILLLSETPVPTWAALLLTFTWAIVMPIVGWWWHTRAIDEQEASAYRDGAFVAGYAYLIGAPAWWMLWRGGVLPEPNGVIIFMTFACIWCAVWFWKKYR